jgi:hypothetical protein
LLNSCLKLKLTYTYSKIVLIIKIITKCRNFQMKNILLTFLFLSPFLFPLFLPFPFPQRVFRNTLDADFGKEKGFFFKELDQPKNMNNLSEFDQENVRNSVIRHPKGRLPGNTRFKRPLKISNDSNKITNGRTQNKCSYCNK